MKSFGVWLHENHLTLSEVVALRVVATTLAQNWPISSNQRTDYETSISTHLPAAAQPDALQQLRSVWPVYELDTLQVSQVQAPTTVLELFMQLLGRGPQQSNTAAVLGVGAIIVATFFDGVLSQLHNWESQPFRQGPHVVREASGHRWGALLPPARCLANAEGPNRPTKVVRVHREIGDRVMHLPVLRETRRPAGLAAISIAIGAVVAARQRPC